MMLIDCAKVFIESQNLDSNYWYFMVGSKRCIEEPVSQISEALTLPLGHKEGESLVIRAFYSDQYLPKSVDRELQGGIASQFPVLMKLALSDQVGINFKELGEFIFRYYFGDSDRTKVNSLDSERVRLDMIVAGHKFNPKIVQSEEVQKSLKLISPINENSPFESKGKSSLEHVITQAQLALSLQSANNVVRTVNAKSYINILIKFILDQICHVDLAFNRKNVPDATGSFHLDLVTKLLLALSEISEIVEHANILKVILPYVRRLHRNFELRRRLLKSEYRSNWKEKSSEADLLSNIRLAQIWFRLGVQEGDNLFISSALKMMDILRSIINSTCTNTSGIPFQFPSKSIFSPVYYSTEASIAFIDASLSELKVRERFQSK